MKELKVLIVDDEILAIEYLREIIPWHEYGYQIVGEAISARQAFDLFVKHHPQIVISDICMPGIGGLEFCSEILARDPSVKILLLTAYKEFEYAKKAIELGVADYLLKHDINAAMLLQVLGKLRAELVKEDNTKSIIKKHAITNFLDGSSDMHHAQENEWQYLESNEGEFVLTVLKEDMQYPVFGNESEPVHFEPDKELNLLYEEIPSEINFIECFKLRNRQWAMLFSCSAALSQGKIWSMFYPIAVKTQELFQKLTGRTFSAVICHDRQKVKNITKLYENAIKTLKFSIFFGTSRIMNFEDNYNIDISRNYAVELEKELQGLSEILKALDTQKITECINRIFESILLPARSPDLFRTACDELIRLLKILCRDHYLEPLHSGSREIASLLTGCHTAKNVQTVINEAFRMKIGEVADKNTLGYSQKVLKAIKYLHENYKSEISVTDVANVLDMSDSHLSRIFRSETGKTILEYLTFIRIEMAKNLLDTYNYKIYEISDMVGYKTSQYFSQVFVRMTGMNPLEYRERDKKHDTK